MAAAAAKKRKDKLEEQGFIHTLNHGTVPHTLLVFFPWPKEKDRATLISPRAGWLFADSCLCGRLGGKDPYRVFFSVVCRDSRCVNEAAAYN